MSIELRPRNKVCKYHVHVSNGTWSKFLLLGVGTAIGIVPSMPKVKEHPIWFEERGNGANPFASDGYSVSPIQASAMSTIAWALARSYEGQWEEYDILVHTEPPALNQDEISILRNFARFAKDCCGFDIH